MTKARARKRTAAQEQRRTAKLARRQDQRRPDHDRSLVGVVCLDCGRYATGEMRHRPIHLAAPWLLVAAETQARQPHLDPITVGIGVRLAWGSALTPAGQLLGLFTACQCEGFEARYAEAA